MLKGRLVNESFIDTTFFKIQRVSFDPLLVKKKNLIILGMIFWYEKHFIASILNGVYYQ